MRIVRLKETQVDDIGAIMAQAFFDDPISIYMYPDESERRRLRPWHFSTFLRYGCVFGEAFTTEQLDGAAVWFPPGQGEILPERLVEAGFDKALDILGAPAWKRFTEVDMFIERYYSRLAPEPHWYLPLIGVGNRQQRHGVGSALLQHAHAKIDKDGLMSYLWTLKPQNLFFYQSNGYAIIAQDIEPKSGIRFWICRRNPMTG